MELISNFFNSMCGILFFGPLPLVQFATWLKEKIYSVSSSVDRLNELA